MSISGSVVRTRCVHLPSFAPEFSVHPVDLAATSWRGLWNQTGSGNFAARTFRCARLRRVPPVADPSTQNLHPAIGYLAPASRSNCREIHPVPADVFDSPGTRWPPPRMARSEKKIVAVPTNQYCESFLVPAFHWLKSSIASRYNYRSRSSNRKNPRPEMGGCWSFRDLSLSAR